MSTYSSTLFLPSETRHYCPVLLFLRPTLRTADYSGPGGNDGGGRFPDRVNDRPAAVQKARLTDHLIYDTSSQGRLVGPTTTRVFQFELNGNWEAAGGLMTQTPEPTLTHSLLHFVSIVHDMIATRRLTLSKNLDK